MTHVDPHFAATGLCLCGCEDCTLRLSRFCVCGDCPCDGPGDHGHDVRVAALAAGFAPVPERITVTYTRYEPDREPQ